MIKSKVTKTDLISQIAAQLGVSQSQSEKFLSAFIDSVTTNLQHDKEVTITGFGTFRRTTRPARKGRNPQTGAEMDIKASTSVAFKTGKGLKDAVQK
jgi:DNA-binding protein HU-beta